MFCRLWIYSLLLVFVNGCGNPQKLRKDLDRAEEDRTSLEKEVDSLEAQNRRLRDMLGGVFATSHNLWVIATLQADYGTASASCADIGYSLPDETSFQELRTEELETNANWSPVKPEEIHVEGKTTGLEKGWAFCRKAID